ncbi:DEAD/DEAH box helicase [Listeria costaricensis]|uniref:DEAD/DEAH box helicase n=1 Tax=Listeria costaricensis TaxID=2026604 RepID=UPI0013C51A0E|nr:DEAD/DEAH box helicase [Listeria costaricensis]
MNEKLRNVIESWLLIEYLSSGNLPEVSQQKPVFKGAQVSIEDFSKIKKENKSYIYFGIFRSYQVNKLLRSYFHDDSEVYNEDTSLRYSLSIQLDENGSYIEKSVFIPQLQFLLKSLLKTDFTEITLKKVETANQEFLDTIEPELVQIFAKGVTYQALAKVQNLVCEQFQTADIMDDEIFTLLNCSKSNEPVELNSLIVADLEQIYLTKQPSKTLDLYLSGTKEFRTIDENEELINKILSLTNLPDSRWPSNNSFKLSMMQQVAVNAICNEESPIFSVNGPPGTGKTTLLKDIFANLITKRAEKMMEFSSPVEAFKNLGKFKLNGFDYYRYKIDDRIKGYGIVVASSNNGAVENISKDLPKKEEIIHTTDKFKDTDTGFSEMIKEVNYFSEYADSLFCSTEEKQALFSEHWGMFSVPMGNQKNINKVFEVLLYNQKGKSLYDNMKERTFKIEDWEKACKDFQKNIVEINQEKKKIMSHYRLSAKLRTEIKERDRLQNRLGEVKKKATDLENSAELKKIISDIAHVKQVIELLPPLPWYKIVINKLFGKANLELVKLQQQLIDLIKKEKKHQDELIEMVIVKEKIQQELNDQEQKITRMKMQLQHLNFHFQDDEYAIFDQEMWLESNYAKRQLTIPWVTRRLNYLRGKTFILALNIHIIFCCMNSGKFYSAFNVISKKNQLDLDSADNRAILADSWSIFHLLIPVVSTTFASFARMYKGMDASTIDNLFIDEAGQATPQSAVGAMWRAKRAIVVGDPAQIEPVVTMGENVFKSLREAYGIEEKYLSSTASVQNLADEANAYGVIKNDGVRIGVPLWVHRRCLNPMFFVSNEISYDGKMVQGAPSENANKGIMKWLDVKGKAKNRQFVEEQATVLLENLIKIKSLDSVYVISPFKAVVEQTKKYVKQHAGEFVGLDKEAVTQWTKSSIGTVHTFQGKEAAIVYFVCGTDNDSDGAANWSCQTANLLNVAITRAKKEFYIIGDYSRFKNKQFYQTIAKYVQEVERWNATK